MARPSSVLLAAFEGPQLPDWLARRLRSGLAGVCLFGSNVVSPDQLVALTTAIRRANPVALIALDEEGGDVTRLYTAVGSPYPGNAWLGRFDDVGETERHARLIAEQLRALGCNLNLAPCLDVNSNPLNPVIGVRSFGADAAAVARHGLAWVAGHQGAGVAACAKHFPGHGDTSQDSHLALPRLDRGPDELAERELVPFEAAVRAGVLAVMSAHVVLPAYDPDVPATFSSPVLEGLLRDRLGFRGVVVSDALDRAGASQTCGVPEAAVRALAAGCDLLCLGSDTADEQLGEIEAAVRAAVSRGRLAASRLIQAAERVRALGRRVAVPVTSRGLATGQFDDPLCADLGQIASAFDVSQHAARVLARRSPKADTTLVRVNTQAGIASGSTPWGPFAALPTWSGSGHFRVVDTWSGEASSLGAGVGAAVGVGVGVGPTVLVGRINHRYAWVQDVVRRVRRDDPDVLVVDMGWPDESRRFADIATFGSSRLIGSALLEILSSSEAATLTSGRT
ncbi:MAG: beta-N-acetylhexosaminidase [Nocardioidaceae bacterium]|nr:beta-N-acetylhexosaminidase [Nocardioidaceae bacterium]